MYLQRRLGVNAAKTLAQNGDREFPPGRGNVVGIAPLVGSAQVLLLGRTEVEEEEKQGGVEGWEERVRGRKKKQRCRQRVDFFVQRFELWRHDPVLFSWRRVMCDFLITAVVFVLLCVFLAQGVPYVELSGAAFQLKTHLRDVPYDSPIPVVFGGGATRGLNKPKLITIDQASTWQDVWNWVYGPLGYQIGHYNDNFLSGDNRTALLSPVRFRTNRVDAVQCPTNLVAPPCYPSYSPRTSSTAITFCGANKTGPVLTYPGIYSSLYDGANGYILDVDPKKCGSVPASSGSCYSKSNVTQCFGCFVTELQTCGFLDDATRFFLVDFVMYNVNADLFVNAKVGFEMGIAKDLFVSSEVRSVRSEPPAGISSTIGVMSIYLIIIALQYIVYFMFVYETRKELLILNEIAEREGGGGGDVGGAFATFRLLWDWLNSRVLLMNPLIVALTIPGLYYLASGASFSHASGNSTLTTDLSLIATAKMNLQVGQTLLALVNCILAIKIYSYFEYLRPFFGFASSVFLKLSILSFMMVISIVGFAWLLTAASSGTKVDEFYTFNDAFLVLVQWLLTLATPATFSKQVEHMQFVGYFVYFGAQILVNFVLIKIAVAICYEAMCIEAKIAAQTVLKDNPQGLILGFSPHRFLNLNQANEAET